MTDYAKFALSALYTEASNYSGYSKIPDGFLDLMELTPDNVLVAEVDVTTTAYTLDLAQFNTITAIFLQNTTATNYITAEWYTQIGTKAAGTVVTANANPDTISAAAGDLITSGGEIGGWVRLASSEDSANDGLHLISAISATEITVAPGSALTANASDTAMTMSFERKNRQRLAGTNGFLAIVGDIVPAGDLVLKAVTGTCEVRYIIVGT